jgi:aspartyl-tRNA synthetase
MSSDSKVSHRKTNMRSTTCGDLRIGDVGQTVSLCGWVQTTRNMNAFVFVDLRDRYGYTQCIIPNPANFPGSSQENFDAACGVGRECVVAVRGNVVERSNKNPNRPTGDIEVI